MSNTRKIKWLHIDVAQDVDETPLSHVWASNPINEMLADLEREIRFQESQAPSTRFYSGRLKELSRAIRDVKAKWRGSAIVLGQ